MRKVIMVMILFVLLSLSVVSANDCFMGNDSISYTDVDVSAINSNSLHDEFDFYSFSQDDDFVDDFIDDVPIPMQYSMIHLTWIPFKMMTWKSQVSTSIQLISMEELMQAFKAIPIHLITLNM